MIGHLEGTVKALRAGFCVISANGVGYKVATTKYVLARLSEGEHASLWTHLAVREDSLDLYGFETEEELRFFELLMTVSGVGPKSALAILDIASIENLRTAIAKNNASYLTKVSGIGKKTAEKIVFELKDKVGIGSGDISETLREDEEALEAMRTLGYSHGEAREALRKVPQSVSGASARVREALKQLGA